MSALLSTAFSLRQAAWVGASAFSCSCNPSIMTLVIAVTSPAAIRLRDRFAIRTQLFRKGDLEVWFQKFADDRESTLESSSRVFFWAR